jgi:hypothetical protein
MTAGSLCAYGGDVVGKVVVGYQGWLCAAGDGSPVDQWKHTNMECWPSVSEYTTTFSGCPFYQNGTKQSGYTGNLGNGQPARMFSNWTDQSVNKHFEWMQQYEIDCAAVQRFGSEFGDSKMKSYRNGIANKVKTAAETYGRKYYIMYDITSWSSFQSQIKTDWTNTMRSHTNSSAYAKEGGKPVVCVWGIGFSDRPGSPSSWTDVVNWFKGKGCYVIGGVPGNFRDISNKDAFKACNMVMAWRVGQLDNFDSLFQNDLTWCNNNGVAYQGDIYPGTSFYNSDPANWDKNQIKRNHGNFMWSQFAAARNKGVQSVYISMFDEVQEATQIFKVAENSSQVPAGKYFLTLDADGTACSSDFYLRLTRDGGKMVKGITDYVTSHPTSHTSSGTKTVPWVTNMTESAAGAAITNAGLVVSGVNHEYHATVPAGRIFSQTPGGGTVVPAGSSVALAASLGPAGGGTTVTFTSVGSYDGYVDEASETSNTGGVSQATFTDGNAIRVGDTGAKKQRKGFLSFDCSSLPDTCTITAATLKLKRGGGIGTPTTLGTITVDVKNVNTGWSDNVALQITDFQGPASASDVATLSYPATTNAWATGSLNATGLTKINKTTASQTQYRIRFTTDDDNDTADDYLGFYSGENATAANRPVLEVTYQ